MARFSSNPNVRSTPYLIPLNRTEKDSIRTRAKEARMKPIVFIRTMALDGKVITVPVINDDDRIELRRQGHNLNQLVHASHAGGHPDIEPTLSSLRALLQRIDQRLIQ